jgi:hypothetical protein
MADKAPTWKMMAEELLRSASGDWYTTGMEGKTPGEAVKAASESRLQLCLLIDIAQSLRALRCPNFVGMPRDLAIVARSAKRLEWRADHPALRTKKKRRS